MLNVPTRLDRLLHGETNASRVADEMKHKYSWLVAKVPALPIFPKYSEPRCENHAGVFEVFHVR